MNRVTILAARPDTAVVVQAEYYSPDEAQSLDSASSMALVATDPNALSRPATASSYWNPIRLYLSTQQNLDDTRQSALVDVLA
ncbi:MAG: hypothetical protein WA803_04505 [Steroidobacteraceae bacterium]